MHLTRSKKFPPLAPAAALFCLFLASPSFAAKATTDYYGVYLQNNKVGYMTVSKDEAATFDGKPAVRTDTETNITLNVLGANASTISKTNSFYDPKSGLPLEEDSRTEAAGRVNIVAAKFSPTGVTYTADIQGTKKAGTLPLKPGEKFLIDPSDGTADFLPHVGMTMKGKAFEPELLSLIDDQIDVVRKDISVIGGQSVETYVVVDHSDMATVTLFVTGKGDLLRILLTLGMEMRKEPKEVALAAPSANQKDLAVTVGITATGAPIANPGASTSVQYHVQGVSHDLPPTDDRQTATYDGTGDDRAATLTVSAKPLPTNSGITRFAKPADAPTAVRPYLMPTNYVACDLPSFVQLAKDTLHGETDIAKSAAMISDYVHKTVSPDPAIPALRTATDILRDPRGVCRDYTTLYTAIARAAGIPTRECVGVVDVGGTFLYHAWPEVWVGDTAGWVALEPTWGRPYADATHIKLAEGEITDLYRVVDDMGRYKIEVLSAK